MKAYCHDANKTDDACCENCFFAVETDIPGLIDCDRENGRSKDIDMVCDHWARRE